jgi:hypothetical protein
MARPFNNDLTKAWKLHVPATIAGKVEYKLFDPILGRPHYAARSHLLVALLEYWLAREEGRELPRIPYSEELKV